MLFYSILSLCFWEMIHHSLKSNQNLTVAVPINTTELPFLKRTLGVDQEKEKRIQINNQNVLFVLAFKMLNKQTAFCPYFTCIIRLKFQGYLE